MYKKRLDRLPAIPLIAMDPYLSVWVPADTVDGADAVHWSGAEKNIDGFLTVDGSTVRFLGKNEAASCLTEQTVTATRTVFSLLHRGVELTVTFAAPAFPDDPEVMSMPVTLVSMRLRALDGEHHEAVLRLHLSDALCYDGSHKPEMFSDCFVDHGWQTALCGQKTQKPLCHSGDRITIDWGYLYLCAKEGRAEPDQSGLAFSCTAAVEEEMEFRLLIAYDDIASVNYFGSLCKAWYRRNGAQITDALHFAQESFDLLLKRCEEWDARIEADSAAAAGGSYGRLTAAAWRQTIAAHKLIATPSGEMAFLSKENASDGCIGTVDVAYPSIPLFLKYNPELVNAMCRPVLEFAEMPVWEFDFAPHDLGRYPYATGQIYAAGYQPSGSVFPPFYLYPAGQKTYDPHYQMPVEECGNMLIMLAAAAAFGAKKELSKAHCGTLRKWADYLAKYGEDPGEQLCTDDFAGHLAHNGNLAIKAAVGVACCGLLTRDAAYSARARDMADRLLERIGRAGNTPLTLTGEGWSMKYNLLWDRVLRLGLFPQDFYEAELASYLPRIGRYGLPLDSRASYTKSDWIGWIAALSQERERRRAFLEPVARYLCETSSRVPFSDWYDTESGCYVHFIARSVQGELFAPMLLSCSE